MRESAGLLEIGPGRWLHSLTRDQAMDAAIQLHRDVCLITTNLDVLDQYALSQQGTASKILELGLDPPRFRSDGVDVAAIVRSGNEALRTQLWMTCYSSDLLRRLCVCVTVLYFGAYYYLEYELS